MSLTTDIINCLWSQVTNDPTTNLSYIDYDIPKNYTLISFYCRNTNVFFIIKGITYYESIEEIDKALVHNDATILTVTFDRAIPD